MYNTNNSIILFFLETTATNIFVYIRLHYFTCSLSPDGVTPATMRIVDNAVLDNAVAANRGSGLAHLSLFVDLDVLLPLAKEELEVLYQNQQQARK